MRGAGEDAMRRSVELGAAIGVLVALAACGGESPGEGAFGGGSSTSSTDASTADGSTSADASSASSSADASSTAGGGGSGEGGGAGGGATCPDLGDPCTTCEAAACADTYCDCYGNVACGALAACVENCGGTPECYQGCATEHPEGISHGALLTHCAGTVCSDSCPGFAPLTDCQLCLYTECQPEMNACVAVPDCTLLLYCLDACGDAECRNDCYFTYPDGSGDAGPVGTCLQDRCAAACG